MISQYHNNVNHKVLRISVLTLLILSVLHTGILDAQTLKTQTIRGRVSDKSTGASLPGATVVLLDSDPLVGVSTDLQGEFEIPGVPVGRQGIRVSYMGYQAQTLTGLNLTSGKELVLDIELEDDIILGEEITIKAYSRKDRPLNEMAVVSARSFTVEETEKYAGSLGDPARMAMNFAGVMGGADQVNDIIIRGNSPIGLLWKLEGIHIPNPNHFGSIGTSGGPISMLNNNVLSNSDFFTGAFPASYGNALSGVFDLRLRNGNRHRREYTFQVGLNGAELGLEGPFIKGQQHSYIAHYRYSSLAALHLLGLHVGVMAIPYYQDISFKTDFQLNGAGHISIFGLGGLNHITLEEDEQEDNFLRLATKTGVLGIAHTWFPDNSCRIKTVIGYSVSQDTELDSSWTGNILHSFYGDEYMETKVSLSESISKKFSSRDRLMAGVDLDLIGISYADSIYRDYLGYYFHSVDVEDRMMLLQSWVQWKHRFTSECYLVSGLHHQQLSLNRQAVLEPRLSVNYDLNERNTLSLGYGLHSQKQSGLVYFEENLVDSVNMVYDRSNRHLGFTRSHHVVAGFQHLFSPRLRLKTEAYYQRLFDIPVKSSPSHLSLVNYGGSFHWGDYDSLVNEGTARNVGLEWTLEHFLGSNFYYLLTLSLFDSKYLASDGILRNTVFNGNFILNILGGYEVHFDRQNSLSLDVKGVWAGGLRYIPIDLQSSRLKGETVYDYSRVYEDRYEDYYRLDVRLAYHLNRPKMSHMIAVDIQNATNRNNHFLEDFNPVTGQIEQEYQIGILPFVLYRMNF